MMNQYLVIIAVGLALVALVLIAYYLLGKYRDWKFGIEEDASLYVQVEQICKWIVDLSADYILSEEYEDHYAGDEEVNVQIYAFSQIWCRIRAMHRYLGELLADDDSALILLTEFEVPREVAFRLTGERIDLPNIWQMLKEKALLDQIEVQVSEPIPWVYSDFDPGEEDIVRRVIQVLGTDQLHKLDRKKFLVAVELYAKKYKIGEISDERISS